MKAGQDPRTDQSTDGPKFPDPPPNSNPRPAPGGAGTGGKDDPLKQPSHPVTDRGSEPKK